MINEEWKIKIPLLSCFTTCMLSCLSCQMKWTSAVHSYTQINSLPNNKILEAFADDKLNFAKIIIFVYNRVENIVCKGENAGYQHFLLFPQRFQKLSFLGLLKVDIVW